MPLRARRLAQTPQIARNHPQVLWQLLGSRTPWGRDELVYRLRNGLTIRLPNAPGARVPIYELFAEDSYRLAEWAPQLPRDFVALDIGAQIGCFTTALCMRRPDGRVIAYEASPVTAEWTRRNVTANGFADRATVHAKAVSDHEGTIEFLDNGSGSGLNGLTSAHTAPSTVQVPCTTFDQAVADAGGRVDLVKLDTEGGEYDIVLGSTPETWRGIPRVVLEYHPVPGHSWSELEEFFTTAGHVVRRHESTVPGWGAVWLTRDA